MMNRFEIFFQALLAGEKVPIYEGDCSLVLDGEKLFIAYESGGSLQVEFTLSSIIEKIQSIPNDTLIILDKKLKEKCNE
jgi:hypothetical protein